MSSLPRKPICSGSSHQPGRTGPLACNGHDCGSPPVTVTIPTGHSVPFNHSLHTWRDTPRRAVEVGRRDCREPMSIWLESAVIGGGLPPGSRSVGQRLLLGYRPWSWGLSGHEWHELGGHGDEGAHHVAVLVFEDVAVVHVAAAVGGEADGDFDDLIGVDADGVLEAAFVVVDGVAGFVVRVPFERDCGG